MASIAVTPDQDALICEIEIAAPPSRVFEALIDPKQVHSWSVNEFCDLTLWEMDTRPGGTWRSISKEKISDTEFEHHGKVLEIDPPRLLVYTWYAKWHNQPSKASVVRVELTPTPDGTRLKLTHSGLADEPKAREGYSGGWPGVLQAIKEYAEKSE